MAVKTLYLLHWPTTAEASAIREYFGLHLLVDQNYTVAAVPDAVRCTKPLTASWLTLA